MFPDKVLSKQVLLSADALRPPLDWWTRIHERLTLRDAQIWLEFTCYVQTDDNDGLDNDHMGP